MFFLAILLLLASPLFTSASPIPPLSLAEIERRWASGVSEQEIHSSMTPRDMSPAWPVARDREDVTSGTFSAALDERTMAVGDAGKKGGSTYVWDVVAGRFGRRGDGVKDIVPVLRPRKEMRYYFIS